MEFGWIWVSSKKKWRGLGKCRSCQPINLVPGSWTLELHQVKPHQTSHGWEAWWKHIERFQTSFGHIHSMHQSREFHIIQCSFYEIMQGRLEVLKVFWGVNFHSNAHNEKIHQTMSNSITVVKSALSPGHDWRLFCKRPFRMPDMRLSLRDRMPSRKMKSMWKRFKVQLNETEALTIPLKRDEFFVGC